MIAVRFRFGSFVQSAAATDRTLRSLVLFAAIVAFGTMAALPAAANAASLQKPLPEFAKIQRMTERHFEVAKLEPWDILARSEVKPLFDTLKTAGWSVPGYKTVLNSVLKDSHFLVRSMRTDEGRNFAQKIAKHPLGYDRLDRLAAMPHGRDTVRDLIKGPDGHKMIDYLTTTDGGTELGSMLSDAPTGKYFNEPTGHIYTVDYLIDVLKQKYAETLEKRKSGRAAKTR